MTIAVAGWVASISPAWGGFSTFIATDMPPQPTMPRAAKRPVSPVTHRGSGLSRNPNTSLADIPLGETEVWRFVTDVHHPVHLHLDAFQVLRRGSEGPGDYDVGWKDTVDVRPAEVVDVAVRFADHAGRFVLHCHNLEHEDMAMMATIRTV